MLITSSSEGLKSRGSTNCHSKGVSFPSWSIFMPVPLSKNCIICGAGVICRGFALKPEDSCHVPVNVPMGRNQPTTNAVHRAITDVKTILRSILRHLFETVYFALGIKSIHSVPSNISSSPHIGLSSILPLTQTGSLIARTCLARTYFQSSFFTARFRSKNLSL